MSTSPVKLDQPNPQGGLHRRLFRSHMLIALIGLTLLVIMLAVTSILRSNALRLTQQRSPTARTSVLALAGVQRSLASLRGWMALGDERFKRERIATWEEEIEPSIALLKTLSLDWEDPAQTRKLDRIESLLKQLKQAQWWIEDVAQTPGNEPARVGLVHEVSPAFDEAGQAAASLIDIERTLPESSGRKLLLATISDFRAHLAQSRRYLASFVDDGHAADLSKHTLEMQAAQRSLRDFGEHSALLAPTQLPLAQSIQDSFTAYRVLCPDVISARKQDDWRVDNFRLRTEAVPLAAEATALLNQLSQEQEYLMETDSGRVIWLSNGALLVGICLVSGMFLATIVLSRRGSAHLAKPIELLTEATQDLSEGNLEHDLLVNRDDEIGELAAAFNRMRHALAAQERNVHRSTEELKRSNAELNQFAYVASHDLKSPLRAIKNLAEWVSEDAGESLSDDCRKDLLLLQERVTRMEGLLDALLEYSRVGRKEDELKPVDVRQLVEDLAATLDVPEGTRIVLEGEFPVPQAPRGALVRVFGNLISNAIKHGCPDGGTVTVTARSEPDYYRFSVADDGPGIAEEYQERVFAMFQTLRPRDEVEGTGMGLALVKKTIEIHGGTVTMESKLGEGTTIHFTWPTDPPPVPDASYE